eukprot:TRINITY_DN3064_c0_g1_i1.p1 TRINITY_DN3064_c0_g1~~TRINITY_DN3064_c0_g1_i1.p1  ORF type:complete len:263 (+),score=25.08 TRINITY_DN3064_c0_g1_i1:37-825(+)
MSAVRHCPVAELALKATAQQYWDLPAWDFNCPDCNTAHRIPQGSEIRHLLAPDFQKLLGIALCFERATYDQLRDFAVVCFSGHGLAAGLAQDLLSSRGEVVLCLAKTNASVPAQFQTDHAAAVVDRVIMRLQADRHWLQQAEYNQPLGFLPVRTNGDSLTAEQLRWVRVRGARQRFRVTLTGHPPFLCIGAVVIAPVPPGASVVVTVEREAESRVVATLESHQRSLDVIVPNPATLFPRPRQTRWPCALGGNVDYTDQTCKL